MNRRDAVTELIFLGQSEMLCFADGLSEPERQHSGAPKNWAPRDVLAHMAFWKLRLAQNLAGAQRGEAVQVDENYQVENGRTFKRYRRASWGQILAMIEAAQQQMLVQLDALSDDDLADPARFPWMNGRPAWHVIAGNCHLHPLAHLAPLYVQRGRPDLALRMWESSYDLLLGLDSSAEWQAVVAYDRACGYALSGRPAQALADLGVALRFNPKLAGWAAQDSDLSTLHDLPEFQALVKPPADEG